MARPPNWIHRAGWLIVLGLALAPSICAAHGVAAADAVFIQNNPGLQIVPFLYLGAKHMVTGYDHLLFLAGVIFFLYRLRDIALYVTLFSLGHSITLLAGVLTGVRVDPFVIDAIIGLSVVYKAFDNLGGFPAVIGFQPNAKAAVSVFGLAHGLGLATKLQDLQLSAKGLVANILAFNVGVEAGQIVALSVILLLMVWWRGTASFQRHSAGANLVLMAAGLVIVESQIAGFLMETTA